MREIISRHNSKAQLFRQLADYVSYKPRGEPVTSIFSADSMTLWFTRDKFDDIMTNGASPAMCDGEFIENMGFPRRSIIVISSVSFGLYGVTVGLPP